jgi:hypothetical protein
MEVEKLSTESNGNPILPEQTLSNESAQGSAMQNEANLGGQAENGQQRRITIFVALGGIVFLAIIAGVVYFLLQPATPTDKIRDIFIIFMALESLLIGLALVILMVQLARLINLLQNDIKPILESTNETVSTLRGTALFLSDNLTEPVVKLNEFLAAIGQLVETFRLVRRK